MPLAITFEEAKARGVQELSTGSTLIDILCTQDEGVGPQAFLIASRPGHVLQAHFHDCTQFHLFVGGKVKVGRYGLGRGGVHYSDAFTPYGPIAADSGEGFTYLTLRPAWSDAIHWIPDEITLAKGRRGRNLTADPDLESAVGVVELIDEPDGVGASLVVAGPGDPLIVPPSAGGLYCVVLSGDVLLDGKIHPILSCIWSEAETITASAGAQGASVMILRFSARKPCPG